MSSIGIPLATRLPTNGGEKTRVVRGHLGRARRQARGVGLGLDAGRLRRGTWRLGDLAAEGRVVGRRARRSSTRRSMVRSPSKASLAVEDAAVVDVAQVALDVAAGQGRAAEQHRQLAREPPLVQLLEVLAHDEGRLHEQAAHAERVGLVLLDGREHLGDPDLDAEVDHLVAVVGEDDVDQVLADVVDVALHRGQHDGPLAALVGPLHVRLEVGDGRLHRLGRAAARRAAASRPRRRARRPSSSRPAGSR